MVIKKKNYEVAPFKNQHSSFEILIKIRFKSATFIEMSIKRTPPNGMII
jgi:hypothetical protein